VQCLRPETAAATVASVAAISDPAVLAFDNAVAELRRANPSLDLVGALQRVATERPELAAARNRALAARR